jgi:hypothetical protein
MPYLANGDLADDQLTFEQFQARGGVYPFKRPDDEVKVYRGCLIVTRPSQSTSRVYSIGRSEVVLLGRPLSRLAEGYIDRCWLDSINYQVFFTD